MSCRFAHLGFALLFSVAVTGCQQPPGNSSTKSNGDALVSSAALRPASGPSGRLPAPHEASQTIDQRSLEKLMVSLGMTDSRGNPCADADPINVKRLADASVDVDLPGQISSFFFVLNRENQPELSAAGKNILDAYFVDSNGKLTAAGNSILDQYFRGNNVILEKAVEKHVGTIAQATAAPRGTDSGGEVAPGAQLRTVQYPQPRAEYPPPPSSGTPTASQPYVENDRSGILLELRPYYHAYKPFSDEIVSYVELESKARFYKKLKVSLIGEMVEKERLFIAGRGPITLAWNDGRTRADVSYRGQKIGTLGVDSDGRFVEFTAQDVVDKQTIEDLVKRIRYVATFKGSKEQRTAKLQFEVESERGGRSGEIGELYVEPPSRR